MESRAPLFYKPGDLIVWTLESVLTNPASKNEGNLRAILTGGVAELVDMNDNKNIERSAIILKEHLGKNGPEFDEEIKCALDEILLRPR